VVDLVGDGGWGLGEGEQEGALLYFCHRLLNVPDGLMRTR
jgi:hypothetical protein